MTDEAADWFNKAVRQAHARSAPTAKRMIRRLKLTPEPPPRMVTIEPSRQERRTPPPPTPPRLGWPNRSSGYLAPTPKPNPRLSRAERR